MPPRQNKEPRVMMSSTRRVCAAGFAGVIVTLFVVSYLCKDPASSSSSSSSSVLGVKSLFFHPGVAEGDCCEKCGATSTRTAAQSQRRDFKDNQFSSTPRSDALGPTYQAVNSRQPEADETMVFDRLLPGEERLRETPGLVQPVVHYLWCGNKKFRFKDYLSVLSAVKIFRPFRLVFHFTHQPLTDDYNSWFQDVKSSVPGLEMQQLSSAATCGSPEMLKTALGFLSESGGAFVGESVVLSPLLKGLLPKTALTFAFSHTADKTAGVIIAQKGFNENQKNAYFQEIMTTGASQTGCPSVDAFTLSSQDQLCVNVPGTVFPRDIMYADTAFAQVARLYFYGRRGPMTPVQDPTNLIPRISHFVRFKGKTGNYQDVFPFNQFLVVLSALYVAGFHHVYIYADVEPIGKWWKELAKENVTLVKVDLPQRVFEHPIQVVQHKSDVIRYQLLYKYGGAYQDFDVVWTSHVPDSLLANYFVASNDWVRDDREFPESFNLGVMLAKPGAKWLYYYLQTHKDFRDSSWGYNSLRMSYRTYELYPHLMDLNHRVMVICYLGICHPSWQKDYVKNSGGDRSPTIPFKWQEVRAIHTTAPKPPQSFSSPEAIKKGTDMYADIGRLVLQKSGRTDVLN